MKIKKVFYNKLSCILLSSFVLVSNPIFKQNVNASEISVSENDIVDDIKTMQDDINESLESSKPVKKEIINKFITLIDFIYYDESINDVKFKDLTNQNKVKILTIISSIDFEIEEKYPNYKNKLSEDYQDNISDLKNKIEDLLLKIKDELGEDTYNNFVSGLTEFKDYTEDAIDVTKDVTNDIYNKGKQKVKSLYEDFKSKNK
ncbi:MAG: hypothetical protein PHN42_05605 [Bacilli bacterium]|nr:hypothetical protein [Bacilli bacterium]